MGITYAQSGRKAIPHIRSATLHVFVAIPGLPREIVDIRNLPSMRIQYEYLKMSYGNIKVGVRVARNVVRKFVDDHRFSTVLYGSATVLSRPRYSV